jgi:hypothetical protein
LHKGEQTKQTVLAAALAPHQKRGLQASDMITRLKVAKAGGRTIAKDILSLGVAGIKGGNKTKELFGISYYHEVGKK